MIALSLHEESKILLIGKFSPQTGGGAPFSNTQIQGNYYNTRVVGAQRVSAVVGRNTSSVSVRDTGRGGVRVQAANQGPQIKGSC